MNARDFAVLTLDEKRLPGLPRQAFKRRSPVAPRDPRDRALGEQIVLGVTKNWLHLCWLASHFAGRPVAQIDPRARLILAVALYQQRFLERVPEHAIVAEAVAQTRRLGEPALPRASGFVNAVLREAMRSPDVSAKLPPRSEAVAYAEIVLSHPRALFSRLGALLGAQDALRFCEHDNRTPPTLVRLARGHTADDLLRLAAGVAGVDPTGEAAEPDPADGRDSGAGGNPEVIGAARGAIELEPHEQPGILVVRGGKQAHFARWAEAGAAQVQDATSAAIVEHLDVRPGMTVLDRCCGVGTKTQQLSEAVGGSGRVFAVDAMGSRISTLRRLAARRPDMANVIARRGEWMAEMPPDWPAQFDRILIDAPCSNTGVLARRAEARYADIEVAARQLPELQLAILRDTWPRLAPGGLLCYATCSVLPEENSQLVRSFLAAEPTAALVAEKLTWPSFESEEAARYRDGGYWALLRRTGAP